VSHRHAAVLVLAGWYLMLLPNNGPGMATISPPVWSAIQHSYDTAKKAKKLAPRPLFRLHRLDRPFTALRAMTRA
jgi:hypothetical protein